MKYLPLLVALATLTPSLVCAQNQQFSDCRTLAMAGNFVGADEALVDGLVCKMGKPATTASASRPAVAKAAEGSKALLGIIEPEILRSKEKAGANPTSAEATPGPAPGLVPGDSAAGGAPSSSLSRIRNKVLGKSPVRFARIEGSRSPPSPDKVTSKESSPVMKKLIE